MLADPVLGVVFARFGVNADQQEHAVDAARRIMVDALERAGLRATDDPLARVAATPSPCGAPSAASRFYSSDC